MRISILLALAFLLASPLPAQRLSWTEQIPVETFAKMREVERYQLQIAEKHYLKGEFKIALVEYEKFLGLYEESAGAPYAQLMWSHCQRRLRKVNTAIREGFQSVIDYWPDTKEALLAGYLIARSYQDIGEVEKAKAAYRVLLDEHDEGPIPVAAINNLLELARIKKNEKEVLAILDELTFETKRTEHSKKTCESATHELAGWNIRRGNWEECERCLATTYKSEEALKEQMYHKGASVLGHLLGNEETRAAGQDIAGKLFALAEARIPDDLSTDQGKARARDALYRIAGLHSIMGARPKIYETYQRVGKMCGTNADLRGRIARYWIEEKQRDRAKTVYRQFENQVAGLGAIAGMLREEGRLDEAIEQYRELIELHAEGTSSYLTRIAEIYEQKKDWKTAIQTWRQIDNFPENYFRMAACHRRLKEWREAISLYAQAKSSERHAARALLSIGHTYEDAGQRENAIKTFQLTCRSYPKSSEASRAHAHLQSKYKITVTLGGAKDE